MTTDARYPLVYVCKFCGDEVARFPDTRVDTPAVTSVCGKPECVKQASAVYKEGGPQA